MQYVQNRHKMFGICMLVNEWMEWGGVVDRRCMKYIYLQNQIIFCILLNKKNRACERHTFLKRQADRKMGFLCPLQRKEHIVR